MSVGRHDELEAVAERFGVGVEQVRRDHLLSHVLAAISGGVPTDDVVFFGGTALSRTYLADARLSEDIDLIALRSRAEVATAIQSSVASGLARSYGRVAWLPALTATQRHSASAVAHADQRGLRRGEARSVDGSARASRPVRPVGHAAAGPDR